MAGIYKLYVVGGRGGFMGADGANPVSLLILVGAADRQWLEPVHIDRSLKPLGRVRTIIPERPDDPLSLLDACLAFAPKLFKGCPGLEEIGKELAGTERMDFHLNSGIPPGWQRLREQAAPFMREIPAWSAELKEHAFTWGARP